jgi:hypothetical protein
LAEEEIERISQRPAIFSSVLLLLICFTLHETSNKQPAKMKKIDFVFI